MAARRQPKKSTKLKSLTPKEEEAVASFIKADLKDRLGAARKSFPHILKWGDQAQRNYASKFFKKPHIAARIENVQVKAAKKTEITTEYVLTAVTETLDRCRQVAPVLDSKGKQVYVEGADGTQVPAFEFNPQGVLKAADMLMKHKGLYELDNRQRDSVSRAMEKLPLEKLEAVAEKLRKIAERE